MESRRLTSDTPLSSGLDGESAHRNRHPPSRESIVPEAAMSPLTAWANFYVITGSSAGALTGLMFVVITLTAGIRGRGSNEQVIAAFSAPSLVHLSVALLVSAVVSAPWPALLDVSLALGLIGVCTLVYAIIVVRRLRRQSGYDPVLEDWLWHAVFPLFSYTLLVVAAIMLLAVPTLALFGVAAATLLLVFIGIHNAWDAVTYITVTLLPHDESKE
jgi:hypothetical protein